MHARLPMQATPRRQLLLRWVLRARLAEMPNLDPREEPQ